jgi:hypothetical protein
MAFALGNRAWANAARRYVTFTNPLPLPFPFEGEALAALRSKGTENSFSTFSR